MILLSCISLIIFSFKSIDFSIVNYTFQDSLFYKSKLYIYKSLLLKTGNGAIVAFANLDVSNNKKAYLDLFSHPSFWSQTPRLITEMEFPPDARVICETGYEDYERIAVLEQINFKQKSHYETEDGRQILIFEN